ncbi:hypothetical protein E2C01_088312 [Portunus trituberculatus]|uniref:Uncharacterized protein n=1 Tax=Portunus trituberculatus TaxID=210409 RepID=A0A5B7J8W2_PORTR|nr:hypothetical protein [Portunus trituberculatus]
MTTTITTTTTTINTTTAPSLLSLHQLCSSPVRPQLSVLSPQMKTREVWKSANSEPTETGRRRRGEAGKATCL